SLAPIDWASLKGGPWVPTSLTTVHRMLAMADVKPGELVYDLGSGDGRILVVAARNFKARAVGIEIDPLLHLLSKLLITLIGLHGQVQVVHGDIFTQDLSKADVVTCFLLPSINEKLAEKLAGELRPGTRVVSNTFIFPGLPLTHKEGRNIYVYRIPNHAALSKNRHSSTPRS
ncbi:MAG: 50S ribosomal protein L11 methyltransferase, partial [Candidatus Bathyarchaeota archaeon]